jgi:hypothetical protein
MSVSGSVMMRLVHPEPAALVVPVVMFAPTRRSLALVVVAGPLSDVAAVPVAAATTSTGLLRAMPEYSRIRMSTHCAVREKTTFTEFAPAAAPLMLAE